MNKNNYTELLSLTTLSQFKRIQGRLYFENIVKKVIMLETIPKNVFCHILKIFLH